MTRVSTYASQQIAQRQLMRIREETDNLVQQQVTGRRPNTFADLGVDTGRALNAHGLLDQLKAQAWVNQGVQTQLNLYDNRLTEIDQTMEGLRVELWKAVSTNDAPTLTQQIKEAYETFRGSLNAVDDGKQLFAGANTEEDSLKPRTLDDLAAIADADLGTAYGNDQVRHSGRVGDGQSFEYGILASDLGTDFLKAFKALQQMGEIPAKMSDAQMTQVKEIAGTILTGLGQLRQLEAANGVRQNRIEAIDARETDRSRIMTGVISGLEDADVAKVATELTAHQELLKISFMTYRNWTELSLANFLR